MKSKIYLLFVASAWLVSCNKFLDAKSQNAFVTPNTMESLQALMDNNSTMNMRFPDISEASADNYFYPNENYASLSEKNRKIYTWSYDDVVFNNDWARSYSAIYQANLALDEIKKIIPSPSDTEKWKNIKGSAHFFRAYQNLFLLYTYAKAYNRETAMQDLGIVLRMSSDPNLPSQRSSVEDGYAFVIADLKEAARLLPLKINHVMRPSRQAAQATLARAYLSMGDYKQALTYADSTLMHEHELLDFNISTDVNISGTLPFPSFNKEILFYGESSNSNSIISPTNFFVDTALYASYKPNDLRKKAYFQTNQKYPKFKGSFSANGIVTFLGISLSEIYLIQAECLIRKGDVVKGLEMLNKLLTRRYSNTDFVPYANVSQSAALTIVLAERRKELVFRGLRWMDIKRLNRENEEIYLKRVINGELVMLNPNSVRYALQIPRDIVEQTGIPQNEF